MHGRTFVWGLTARRLALGLATVALSLAAALALAACDGEEEGGDASVESTTADPTQPAPAPSATVTTEEERPTGFLGQHGLYATFAPADVDLYRALLPEQFDMPERPLVLVFIADYYDINIPLSELYPDMGLSDMVPYLEGAVLLRCKYQGRTGLHVITMPVDDRTANDAGRAMGFPKYVADEITLEEEEGSWMGRVVHQGQTVLTMSFTPAPDATPQEGGAGGGAGLFQLVPPGEGPEVSQVNLVSSADSRSQAVAGTVTIEVDPEAEWAGLMPEGSVGAAFRETTGVSNLVWSTLE